MGGHQGRKKPGLESWWWNEETEKAVKENKDRLKCRKVCGSRLEKLEEMELSTVRQKW